MSLQDELIRSIRGLAPHVQVIVKALLDELAQRNEAAKTVEPTGWLGCLEHLGVSIPAEEIDEARRRMWAGFPRSVQP